MPGRRLRILLLSHLGSRRAPTGAENVLVHLARGLKARGHEVAVAAPGQWVLEPELERAGVGLRRVAVRSCWLVQSAPQPLPLQAWRLLRYLAPDRGSAVLRRVMRELAPDVVLVNCLPHLRGAAAARACGLPVVWHLHEILPPGLRRRCFARRLRRDATRIVAVSEAVASWLREEGLGGRVEVVLNGVAPPAAMPERGAARVQFGLPPEACVVGLFSQLVPHKGALDFVRAAHLAAERAPGLWFLLAGRGPRAFVALLEREIAAGPAAERIRLVPPQPEIWPLLAAVDVAAITTLWPDPLPRVVMEAMAVGLPVAGYGGGGVPEMVVASETGLLCAPGDLEALASACARLGGDPGLRRRLGTAGAARAAEHFSVERHLERMEAVLAAAAASGRGR
jgi:glycosyltransferase involved in cell wall biosynthesis